MSPPLSMIKVQGLDKTYEGGFQALKGIDLEIHRGEIFALLGANGAGKTTFISCVCGILNATSGSISVDGFDVLKNYRQARRLIGLVPQELTGDAFETVRNTVSFSRGLFGLPSSPDFIEEILRRLHLWDKRDNKLMTLSGGMKRRVLIAKALSHEPKVLFLDEPTAGVDVELRKSMWDQVRDLQETGTTIILTTHYIEEAEEMADRVGVMRQGQIVLVEEKSTLMKKLGFKEIVFDLLNPLDKIPEKLSNHILSLRNGGKELVYSYGSQQADDAIQCLIADLHSADIKYCDIQTAQSSLEDIFVGLVGE